MAVPDAFVDLAHTLADTAGEIQRRYFRAELGVERKSDESPVTIADRECEARMRELVATRAPEHGFLGEEYAATGDDSEWVWCVDPIDGTKSFICGRPQFGTLIALLHRGRPVLGIIDQAILRERWLGIPGRGTTLNGRPVRVRACAALAEAILFCTSPRMYRDPAERAAFDRVESRAYLSQFSSDCYGYALLATGFADTVVERDLFPFDFMSLIPVVEGAGGIITDWAGRPLGLGSDGHVVASGDARVHDEVLGLLAQG